VRTGFIAILGATSAIVLASGAMASAAQADAPDQRGAIQVGSQKQFFIDDFLIASSTNVALTMNCPERAGKIVFESDTKEGLHGHEYGWAIYPSVAKVNGKYQLWYQGRWRQPIPGKPDHVINGKLFAESTDGIHFQVPLLDIRALPGGRKTNMVLPLEENAAFLHESTVFVDSNPKEVPSRKYKAVFDYAAPGQRGATWMAHSPDGIHWTYYAKPGFRASDTGNVVFWDDRIGRYVGFFRIWLNRKAPRAIVRCEFDDPTDFGKDQLILAMDEKDPDFVDLYTNAAVKYEGIYLMFPSAHEYVRKWQMSPEHAAALPPGKRMEGLWDIQLAVSRDGIHWTRPDRRPFVALSPYDQWDSAMLSMARGLVVDGDEIWMYYWGRNYPHLEQYTFKDRPQQPGFGRLRLRRDGFVSADAAYTGGELTTKPIVFAGRRLNLNVQTGAGGSVKVEAQDAAGRPIPGFTATDSSETYGNWICRAATWHGKDDVSGLVGKPIRLRFIMRDAKLYSFQFAER
jgi:hypothetical protein